MDKLKQLELIEYLSITHRALLSQLQDRLSDYEITVGSFHLLFPLYEEDGVYQKKLCEIFGLDKATVGRGLKKLEEKGFVRREEDQDDRRRNLVYLTEKSKELEPEFVEILESIEERSKKGLSSEEMENLRKTIRKICLNLGVECIEDVPEVKDER